MDFMNAENENYKLNEVDSELIIKAKLILNQRNDMVQFNSERGQPLDNFEMMEDDQLNRNIRIEYLKAY